MRYPLFLFAALFFLLGCEDEEIKVLPPSIETESVKIDAFYVSFSGTIKNPGNVTIDDHGFLWDQIDPTYNRSNRLELGTPFNNVVYTNLPKENFANGTRYILKSYLKVGNNVIYGLPVEFMVPGNEYSAISSFSPSSGVPGTIVTIQGTGFKPGDTRVFFDGINATITSIVETSIVVQVPSGVDLGYTQVIVQVGSNSTYAPDYFYRQVSQITDVVPATGTFDDLITIYAKDLPASVYAYIGGSGAQIVAATQDYIQVKVPFYVDQVNPVISIYTNAEWINSPVVFTMQSPEITSFEPMEVTFGDVVSITGKNFNPIAHYNGIVVGGVSVAPLEATSTTLKFLIPNNFVGENGRSKIALSTIGTVESIEELQLKLHTITSLDITTGRRGQVIQIYGENFNPDVSMNIVTVGNYVAAVQSCQKTIVSFLIPELLSSGDHEISVSIAGRNVVSAELFSFSDPWTTKAFIPGGPRYDAFSFTINNIGYVGGGLDINGNLKQDMYAYSPASNTWTRKADIPVGGEGTTSFSTSTKGYVLRNGEFWQFDPVLNKWNSKADFPGIGLIHQSAFAIGDRGFVGTGNQTWNVTSEFYEYNEANDEWIAKPNYPGYMADGIGFSDGTLGYFTFGTSSWTSSLYAFDPVTEQWTHKTNIYFPQWDLTYSRLRAIGISADGKAFFGTGTANSWNYQRFSDLYEYNPANNEIKRLSSMPNKGRSGAFGFFLNGKVYVGGGRIINAQNIEVAINDFYEYDPQREE